MPFLKSGLEPTRHCDLAPRVALIKLGRIFVFCLVALSLCLANTPDTFAAKLKKGAEPPELLWTNTEGAELT